MNTTARIVVCGSREFSDFSAMERQLDSILKAEFNQGDKLIIVSGTCRGADLLGERFARDRGLQVEHHPADWEKHGRSAGFKRNEEMVAIADLVIAFDLGTRGTKHTVNLARKQKVRCYHIDCREEVSA